MARFLIFIALMLFIVGCGADGYRNEYENKVSTHVSAFNSHSPMICWTHSPGARWAPGRESIAFISNDEYILVDNNSSFIKKDLSGIRYSVSNCEVLAEKQTFFMEDGEYILLDGKPKKLNLKDRI